MLRVLFILFYAYINNKSKVDTLNICYDNKVASD